MLKMPTPFHTLACVQVVFYSFCSCPFGRFVLIGLALVSFAGWAVSLCALGAAVQTHAKLTMASTVNRST